jgi:hypothetical protein
MEIQYFKVSRPALICVTAMFLFKCGPELNNEETYAGQQLNIVMSVGTKTVNFQNFSFFSGLFASNINFPKAAKLGNCAVAMGARSFSGTIGKSSTLGPIFATKDVY